MGKKGTPHRKYSKEEKMRYVRLHLEDHISVRQIERDYGIGNALVSSWVKRYLQAVSYTHLPRVPRQPLYSARRV